MVLFLIYGTINRHLGQNAEAYCLFFMPGIKERRNIMKQLTCKTLHLRIATDAFIRKKIKILNECGIFLSEDQERQLKDLKYESKGNAFAQRLLLGEQHDIPSVK